MRRFWKTVSDGAEVMSGGRLVQRETERERVYLPQNKEQTYKNILNISAVAGYQKGKPIKSTS